MDVPALLTTSSDHPVSCSSRMIETSTVTPSLATSRDKPEWTILGSRSTIAASTFGAVLFDGAGVFQPLAPLPRFAAIFVASRSSQMRLKKPTRVLIDEVRIVREANDAIIDHVNAGISAAHL